MRISSGCCSQIEHISLSMGCSLLMASSEEQIIVIIQMLKDELGKLRKLIKSAEHGEGTYEAIYKKLDRIEHILQEDSE